MISAHGASKMLILNCFRLADLPYGTWLAPGSEAVLLTSASTAQPVEQLRHFAEVVEVDDYAGSPLVEWLADDLHSRHRFDAIVALSERDVLRAARLRERWGLSGQGTASTVAFRDKIPDERPAVQRGASCPAPPADHHTV